MNKQFFRIISFLLSSILFIQAFPSISLSASAEILSEPSSLSSAAKTVMEVLEKRSEYAKHYRLSVGSFKMITYPTPVHYQENKTWTANTGDGSLC